MGNKSKRIQNAISKSSQLMSRFVKMDFEDAVKFIKERDNLRILFKAGFIYMKDTNRFHFNNVEHMDIYKNIRCHGKIKGNITSLTTRKGTLYERPLRVHSRLDCSNSFVFEILTQILSMNSEIKVTVVAETGCECTFKLEPNETLGTHRTYGTPKPTNNKVEDMKASLATQVDQMVNAVISQFPPSEKLTQIDSQCKAIESEIERMVAQLQALRQRSAGLKSQRIVEKARYEQECQDRAMRVVQEALGNVQQSLLQRSVVPATQPVAPIPVRHTPELMNVQPVNQIPTPVRTSPKIVQTIDVDTLLRNL